MSNSKYMIRMLSRRCKGRAAQVQESEATTELELVSGDEGVIVMAGGEALRNREPPRPPVVGGGSPPQGVRGVEGPARAGFDDDDASPCYPSSPSV